MLFIRETRLFVRLVIKKQTYFNQIVFSAVTIVYALTMVLKYYILQA